MKAEGRRPKAEGKFGQRSNVVALRTDPYGISMRSDLPMTIAERSDCLHIAASPNSKIQNRKLDHGVAVTSISPNPAKLARQRLCLQSWLDVGLRIIAVNSAVEISDFEIRFSDLNIDWHCCDKLTTIYDRPTQKISMLIDVGRQTGQNFILMNSDIEIYGDTQPLAEAFDLTDALTLGVRFNHHPRESRGQAMFEFWGIDVFGMTPDMAATFPDLELGVGKPTWDYLLPEHFRRLGYRFKWIRQPLFFHELHELGWSDAEWLQGAALIQQHYGLQLADDCIKYRLGLDVANRSFANCQLPTEN